jgi:hypothetical protein
MVTSPLRPAIAMIELILAIVVMAIVLSAVPLMFEAGQQGDEAAIKQEAIVLAATQLQAIQSLRWDENSINGSTALARIMDVVDNDLDDGIGRSATNNRFRIGAVSMHVDRDGTYRRKFYDSTQPAAAPSALGPDSGESAGDTTTFDDIDDYDGYSFTTSESNTSIGYKIPYTVATTVDYQKNDLSTASTSQSTGVKWIAVRVTGTMDTNISLFAYACNLGETKILEKYVGP